MLDWLFESARFSLAGGALGVAFWLVASAPAIAPSGAGGVLVVFQPTIDAAAIAASSAAFAGVVGGAAELWSRWRCPCDEAAS